MTVLLLILLGAAILLLLVAIVWRLVSHRTSLPCPSWLAWMVEMDSLFCRKDVLLDFGRGRSSAIDWRSHCTWERRPLHVRVQT